MSIRLIEENEKEEEEETEEQRKKRIGYPSDNIEQLIKDAGFEESLEKFKEAKVDDAAFWSLVDDKLEEHLEMKIYGKRKRFLKKLAEIKAAHEKQAEEKHEESKKLKK